MFEKCRAEVVILSTLIFIFWNNVDHCESVGAGPSKIRADEFCYWEDPVCAPPTWPGLCATGQLQSPIDLSIPSINGVGAVFTQNAIYRLYHLYGKQPLSYSSFQIQNTGHSVQVTLSASAAPLILTDPFPPNKGRQYTFSQMHFHWGLSTAYKINGSEHTINGVPTVGEVHLVHYATQYGSFSEALAATTDPVSVLVIAILLGASKLSNPALVPIISATPSILPFDGTILSVTGQLNFEKLFPLDLNLFWYRGSLTSPTCDEQVQWLVHKDVIPISNRQMAVFRQIQGFHGLQIPENFRYVQPRNSRIIEFYKVRQSYTLLWGPIRRFVQFIQELLATSQGFAFHGFVGSALMKFGLESLSLL